jgi:dihydrofolate synthase / folylpolyglutamate synthase
VTPRAYLASLEFHGIKLGLEKITALLQAAGNPHHRFPAVHIAGTNGKGSVAAMTDAMLQAAGYKTGRFTSPHLIDLRERFLVNSRLIGDEALDAGIEKFRDIAGGFAQPPTYFELVTAIAFDWFAREKVDVAVVEVGMGGRFDSTNVVRPAVTVITNIGFDHMQYLGDTLEKIAFEKAGIIKPGVPLVLAERNEAPRQVILAQAEDSRAPVHKIAKDFEGEVSGDPFALQFRFRGDKYTLGPVPLGLAGRFQCDNAAAAVATARMLQKQFDALTDGAIVRGLTEARWPCRMEKVLDDPPVIIDVAHNAHGAEVLAREMPRCVIVLAVSSDKDAAAMAHALQPVCDHLIVSQFTGPRAMPTDELSARLKQLPHERVDNLKDAIARGIALASTDRPLLITGSIFTAGEARQILTDHWHAKLPLF